MSDLDCPHCGKPVFRKSADRLRAPTTMLILHKSKAVEINCGSCKQGILLPLQPVEGETQLKKATRKRHVIRRDLTTGAKPLQG